MSNPVVSGFHSAGQLNIQIDLLRYPVRYFQVFQENQLVGTFQPVSNFSLNYSEKTPITVECVFTDGSRYHTTFLYHPNETREERNFKPGDILVACDNYDDFLPPGYMGHAAMVIDDEHIIEAVGTHPQLRKAPIEEFLTIHPRHMQLRCKDENVANGATNFAWELLEDYNYRLENGMSVPSFSFSPFIPLDDLEGGFYCSKIVWLCYYYGAGMEFENDFFLFAPEDLATNLEYDERFEVIYKHPKFVFHIDL